MKKILLILIMVLSLISCKTTPKIIYKYVQKEVFCPVTQIPEFPDFDYDLPLTHPDNIEILLQIMSIYKSYVEELNAEIQCYIDQTKKKEDKKNKNKISKLINNKEKVKKYIKRLEEKINEIKKKR